MTTRDLAMPSRELLASDIMSEPTATCTPDTPLGEVARLMVECACGLIPVLDSAESRRPVGVVTDRDIVCRVLAQGHNPLDRRAADCMSSQVMTVFADDTLEDCMRVMQGNDIRRVVVVDRDGPIVGIVSQADVARRATAEQTGALVRNVSEPTTDASRLAA